MSEEIENLPKKKKKDQIAVRVPHSLLTKLETHIQQTGMSQTEIVVSALARYLDSLDDIPVIDRLLAIEKRLSALENQNK